MNITIHDQNVKPAKASAEQWTHFVLAFDGSRPAEQRWEIFIDGAHHQYMADASEKITVTSGNAALFARTWDKNDSVDGTNKVAQFDEFRF